MALPPTASIQCRINMPIRDEIMPADHQLQVQWDSAANRLWSNIVFQPSDAIWGVMEAFARDPHPDKINLSVGAYRDDNGQPFVLPSVRQAEDMMHEECREKEYAPRDGLPAFNSAAAQLAFGRDSPIIQNALNATVQTVGGTGALHLAAYFLAKFYKTSGEIFVSNPTWITHLPIFELAGLKISKYRYYDQESCGLDWDGGKEDLSRIPLGSIVLLQACAHNPTGVDPTPEQWREISAILKNRKALVLFDMAYQGFASGCPDRDAQAVRQFVRDGHQIILAQSFAKNMGLYGDRIGALSVVCRSREEVEAVTSQLKALIRPVYLNPPIHGARIVATILNTPTLYAGWLTDVKVMSDRTMKMRQLLVDNLQHEGSARNWSHITQQTGMFCFSGLSPTEVDAIIKDHFVYLPRDGRMSMAAVTSKNVKYLAKAIHAVTDDH